MKRVSFQQYKKYFDLIDLTIEANGKRSDSGDNDEKYSKAFEYAVRTREFEINLYWQRAKYFWTFIAAAFAAFDNVHYFSHIF